MSWWLWMIVVIASVTTIGFFISFIREANRIERALAQEQAAAKDEEFRRVAHLVRLIEEGLQTDGGHHKQWYLEQIADALEFDLSGIRGEYEKGIPP